MNIDLHIHTTYSDGDLTPFEAVVAARGKGLSLIAVTDHDECRGFLELCGKHNGINVLSGVELASKFGGEAHVLGYGIDCRNLSLLEHISYTYGKRRERAVSMVSKLKRAGLNVSMKEVEKNCVTGVIGRPHIAAALVKNGYAGNVKEAFSKYLSKHGDFYVSYEKISVREAAALITGAGGKPVLAHPGLMAPDVRESLWPELKSMGFWGIEAYHTAHSDDQCAEYEEKALKHGLFVTAGSDFHGSAKPFVNIGEEKRGGEYLLKSIEALLL